MLQVHIDELARLYGDGRLSPAEVVNAARPQESPLHDLFEWDDAKAAEERRLDQARGVIRSVEYSFTVRKVTFSSPRYVHDPEAGKDQGYVDIQDVRVDAVAAWQVTRHEINAALGILKRAHSISVALSDGSVSRALGTMIADLERLRSTGDAQARDASAA